MTTMGIVEVYENKWYMTRRFKEFFNDCAKKIIPEYVYARDKYPEIDKEITALSLVLQEWDPDIPKDDVVEAVLFIKYWIDFGVCPFERYGDIRQEWL